MSDFNQAIQRVLARETGQYVIDDHGQGPSRWGITLRSLREFYPDATADHILHLTSDQATDFYRQFRWERYHLDRIDDLALANKVFDELVNMGGGGWILRDGKRQLSDGAITLLQKAVNLPADGILGPVTAAAVNAADPTELLAKYRMLLVQHYDAILKAHPEWERDRAGWMARANA